VQQLAQHDARLETSQAGAQAGVDAGSEGEVGVLAAAEVQAPGRLEDRGVAVGGPEEAEDALAGSQPDLAEVQRLGRVAPGRSDRRSEAQALLHGAPEEPRVLRQTPTLRGKLAQQGHRATEQARGGLVARDEKQHRRRRPLGLG